MQRHATDRQSAPQTVLVVGDPNRSVIGRAIFGALLVSALFVVFSWASKHARVYGMDVPWQNDPYDLIVSFMIFFVPLVAVCCLARVTLCKRSEPLPVMRVRDLLRGCRVAVGAALITLIFDGVGVLAGATRQRWSVAAGVSVVCLAVMALLAGKVMVDLVRVPVPRLPEHPANEQPSDWLGDFALVAERQSQRLGPLRRPARGVVRLVDRTLFGWAQRHPVFAAELVATVMAVLVIGAQGLREGYSALAFAVGIVIFACGMFSLLVAGGAYVGVVRSNHPLHGARRRALDAGVLASASLPLVFGFRAQVWWLAGSRLGSLHQIGALMGLSALAVFLVVFVLESLAGAYSAARA